MKKNVRDLVLLASFAVACTIITLNKSNRIELTDLAIQNVEALSAGEGSDGKLYPGYEYVSSKLEGLQIITVCSGHGYRFCV